ncbi:MAG: polysaccharide deacetylase family protein [Firmicutes bacterium]|nr:polysaccharide deacetylase family protein [Bacillota bacterium]
MAAIIIGTWLANGLIDKPTEVVEEPVDKLPPSPPLDEEITPPVDPIEQIPILMYHVIGDGSGSLHELYVNPSVFASQMEYLYANGYHTITLEELYKHWQEGEPLPPRPIVITFDDGYRSDYEEAFPILQTYGFKAVHFLYVKKLQQGQGLTREEIATLMAAGHEIGNHTYSHVEIHRLSQERLAQETQTAKDALEEMLNIPIVSFCYPVGRYSTEAVNAVDAAGHKIAVTTEYGYARPEQGLLTLQRIRINRSDGLQGFIQKLKQYEALTPAP